MTPAMVEDLRAGYSEAGERGFWEASLRSASGRIQELGSEAYFEMAVASAQLGRPDEAFEHLESLVASRDPRAPQSIWEPSIAPLRSDPRFAEFRRRFGLA